MMSELTSAQLYRQDVGHHFTKLTPAQENDLIERARAGEDVRNEILISLQEQIMARASRFVSLSWHEKHVEWGEFVQAASIAVLANVEKSLKKEAPYPYLVGIARLAMLKCVNGEADLIKTHGGRESLIPISLDAPASLSDETHTITLGELIPAPPLILKNAEEDVREANMPSLSQALSTLTQKQYQVVTCLYGMGEYEGPRSQREVGKLLGTSTGNIDTHHQNACARLRAAFHLEPTAHDLQRAQKNRERSRQKNRMRAQRQTEQEVSA